MGDRLFYWQTARNSDHRKLDDRTEGEIAARIAATGRSPRETGRQVDVSLVR
jgi:hypothetical protein